MPAPMTHRVPVRPSWQCEDCAQPWPCLPVKSDLGVEFTGQPTLLFYYMAAHAMDFIRDRTTQGERPTAALYSRFFHWIRSAS